MSIYELRNIRKTYDKRIVVDIDHLVIENGEILALVGPSGAGKSTLLRMLNFLEAPSEGKLFYKELAINGNDVPLDLRRQVTTVFQQPALLSTSVIANVNFGPALRGEHKLQRQKIKGILNRMGLEKLERARATTLSGGEAQRVALARAIVIDPEVLLLDEPSANLDPYNVSMIEDVVREMNSKKKMTVVLVTHNIFQAKRLAHRIGLMLEGKLIELSDSQTFFEMPHDPRTCAFVNGEMVY